MRKILNSLMLTVLSWVMLPNQAIAAEKNDDPCEMSSQEIILKRTDIFIGLHVMS